MHTKCQIHIVIPARLGSTRLAGKPLLKLGEKTMIEHVSLRAVELCEQILAQDKGVKIAAAQVVVATDDEKIAQLVSAQGVSTVMTDSQLKSGTDRVAAALENKNLGKNSSDLVINIQGDEPFFSLSDLEALIFTMLEKPEVKMGTLGYRRKSSVHFFSSQIVKIVRTNTGLASYFSRAPIPWPRAILGASGPEWKTQECTGEIEFWQHVGVYAFRMKSLLEFTKTLSQSPLEEQEGLEQLRAIEAGWQIAVVEAKELPHGIDTAGDLKLAQGKFA